VKTFGLSKKERLKSRKQIDLLFQQGKSFSAFPLRVTFRVEPSEAPGLQAGFTVSKRNFKRAVDRNRIKRLLREAYRLRKNELKDAVAAKAVSLHVFFLYSDQHIQEFAAIQNAMQQALAKLLSKLDAR
jgi:ribonuclease P protein component